MNSVLVSRVRVAGKLAVNKLEIIQQKESAVAKQHRRQLSQTMAAGKIATARIKAETIIASDIYVELLELLELYCHLIVSRAALVDPMLDKDPRLAEAVHTIIHAAPAADIKELTSLRDILVHIVNKDIVSEAIDNKTELVPEQIIKRVKPQVPSEELVDLYLTEIAKAYQVNVPGLYEATEEEQDVVSPSETLGEGKASNEPPGPSSGQTSSKSTGKPAGKPPQNSDDLWERFNNLKR